MITNRVDQAFSVFLIVFGCFIVWTGMSYGFMRDTTPGPGYFPILVVCLVVSLSVVNLTRSLIGSEVLKDSMNRSEISKIAIITISLVAVVFATPYTGLVIAVSLLMLIVGFTINPSLDRKFLLRLLPTCLIFPVFLKVAFGKFLGVPIPVGFLGF